MYPEQRLSIREAVEAIADYGPAPISESALRARIRARRIGAVRVGNRVYTNPLNLVTAGLLPIDVLNSTVSSSQEIDDQQLQEWLNPEETAASTQRQVEDAPGSADGPPKPAVEASSCEPTNSGSPVGPLERLLDPPHGHPIDQDSPAATSSSNSATTVDDHANTARPTPVRALLARQEGRRRPCPWKRPGRTARLFASLTSLAVIMAVAVVIAIADRGPANAVTPLRPISLKVGGDGTAARLRIENAVGRGDYDRAVEVAALSGNGAALDQVRDRAAAVLLNRAERAVRRGQLSDARRTLDRARDKYGAAGKRVADINRRIGRAQRAADDRRRAAASATRRTAASTTNSSPTPAVAGSTTAKPTASTSPETASRGSAAPTTQSRPSGSGGGSRSRDRGTSSDKTTDPGLF